MFGSLVIVYPTAHRGGELVLRHKRREWTFDANTLMSFQSSPSLAYVAFYSDIEHEVLKVTSGSRVTLTYNLYLVPRCPIPGVPVDVPAALVKPNLKDNTNFRETLCLLLEDPEFMHGGGTLAFNLAHLYPITFGTELRWLTAHLKGEDAHVYRSCLELELKPKLRMIYSHRWNCDEGGPDHGVMMKRIVENPSYDYYEEDYEGHLVQELGGTPVNLSNGVPVIDSERTLTWLTDFAKSPNQLKDRGLFYENERDEDGNDVSLKAVYCSPCLIVQISLPGRRL